MLEGKIVAVAGATSYLASHLIPAYTGAGCQVVPIVRDKDSDKRVLSGPGIQEAVALSDATDMAGHFRALGVDILVNCICNYGKGGQSGEQLLIANTLIPLQLKEACDMGGVDVLINVGTALSDRENAYSLTKNCASDLLRLYSARGSRVVNVRSEIFYGPFERDTTKLTACIIRGVIERAKAIDLSSGQQARDFLHVADLSSAIVEVANHAMRSRGRYESYDVGTGELHTVREFAEEVVQSAASPTFLNFGALPDRSSSAIHLDPSKIKLLGWKPRFGLAEGIRDVLASEMKSLDSGS